MAVTAFASGTQTAVINTEHFLPGTPFVNEKGTFTFHIDANAMTTTDSLEVRAYQKILTGGTARVAYYQRFDGEQPSTDKIKISVPLSNDLAEESALAFSIKQIAGTGREYPWKVLKYA